MQKGDCSLKVAAFAQVQSIPSVGPVILSEPIKPTFTSHMDFFLSLSTDLSNLLESWGLEHPDLS